MGVPLWPKGGVKKTGLYIHSPMDTSAAEIDMRQEMQDILEGTDHSPQRGHWVIFRRMETEQRCTCWNEVGSGDDKYSTDERKYDEADENCTECGGTGYLYDDELHLTRRRLVAPPVGLSEQEVEAAIGIMNVDHIVYYFMYYVNPTEKDKILEIKNDKDGKPTRPFSYTEVHSISTAEPLRDLKGRIEYWRCSVKQENI